MRFIISFAFFFLVFKQIVHAQFVIEEFPKTMQFVGREDNNFGIVSIKGTAINKLGEILILKIYANSNLIKTSVDTVKNKSYNFRFDTPVKAAMLEYSFKLYSKSLNSETELVINEASQVLCGDAIVLYGQSNMAAINGYEDFKKNDYNRFISTFYVNAFKEFVWGKANFPYAEVGTIGSYLAKNIIEEYQIPICIINGSLEGASIEKLTRQNYLNPKDISFPYGMLMTRIIESGLQNKIKILAFSQGEADAGLWYQSCNDYPKNFDSFYKLIKNDLPNLNKIYVFQTNILNGNYVERAGFLRDFQRKTKSIYPDVEAISTVGLEPFDGIHFGSKAYQEKASKLSKLIFRDFFGLQDLKNINSPNIQYAYYTSKKDSIILVFDKEQDLVFPEDKKFGSFSRRLIDHISLSSDSTNVNFNHRIKPVIKGYASGNKVILILKEPLNYKFISYLPSTFSDEFSNHYDGVHIKNVMNLNALSFYLFPILDYPPNIDNKKLPNPRYVNASAISSTQINLNWSIESDEMPSYKIQVLDKSGNQIFLDSLNKKEYTVNTNSIKITGLVPNKEYTFKILSCNGNDCSEKFVSKPVRTFYHDSYKCSDLTIPIEKFDKDFESEKSKNATKAQLIQRNSNYRQNNFESFSVFTNDVKRYNSKSLFKSLSQVCR